MMRKIYAILVLSFILAVNSVYAGAFVDDDLSETLKNSPANKELTVIVRLNNSPDFSIAQARKLSRPRFLENIRTNARRSQEGLKPFFKANPVKKSASLWLINGFSLTADAGTIKKLSSHPAVNSITSDRDFGIPPVTYSSSFSPTWNISQINAHILWSLGFTGSQIVVAVMDTGADVDNPHLHSSYRGGSNSWFDPTGIHPSPYDGIGHGTQALGIILGSNDIDTTIGIAPSAKWIAAKIFNDAGSATTGGIHLAFQWLLDPDGDPNTDDAPHIINCSWGILEHTNQCVTEFQQDVSILRQVGIAVVFAAGNENVNPSLPSSVSPANYPESVSVGSVDGASMIASSSSRGPSACDGSTYPKLVAPGVSIETCDLSFGGLIDQHVYVNGTSFSAPHVSAGFALLMQAFPEANNIDVEQALIASAVDLGVAGPDNAYGNGQVDLYAAFQILASDYCVADLNHNRLVDMADLQILVEDWLSTGCAEQSPCGGDLNASGKVDFYDFAFFSSQYKFASGDCPQ